VIYLDTSVVVALLTPAENSEIAQRWFKGCRAPVISSDWLIPETHSALGIKQRVHGLPSKSCAAAAEPFERLPRSGVDLRSLDRAQFRQAADLHPAAQILGLCSALP